MAFFFGFFFFTAPLALRSTDKQTNTKQSRGGQERPWEELDRCRVNKEEQIDRCHQITEKLTALKNGKYFDLSTHHSKKTTQNIELLWTHRGSPFNTNNLFILIAHFKMSQALTEQNQKIK